MNILRTLSALGCAVVLSACGAVEAPTRNAPLDGPTYSGLQQPAIAPSYTVEGISIGMPTDMRVSEANSYYPIADIVWRGDPLGDRKQQIANIFYDGLSTGTSDLSGTQPVDIEINITRFHSLTERTRWSVGGVHSIKFELTARDAVTGEILIDARPINADLPGFGGEAAYRAEQEGQTQKVRITAHLALVIKNELTRVPGAPGA